MKKGIIFNISVIFLIVAFFGLIKLDAVNVVNATPEWFHGLILLIVFIFVGFKLCKFIFDHRRKDDE